ncbi:transcriptional regulator, GntR family [Paenibacillus aquistagni]|uniref:Transcriptional regulator, GntR family n=1 Tax=Paenibacillus aquistagni TaxID=1852522 RepID=A0A1X7LSY8_9BACL|nr:GntR family transcriptional regulator [Paenibacillus aquistagni]SMG56780.1 transcriptional regulator, GntR family [Paenibacillus aquistagni]
MLIDETKSIYLQIAELIENDILSGTIEEDGQVPSTNQFAKVLQINPATAAKGINLLVDEGILFKKRGVGMFVSEGAKSMVLKKRRKQFAEIELPRLFHEAQAVQITKEELIQMIMELKEGRHNDNV